MFKGVNTADTGPDQNADAVQIGLLQVKAGVTDGLAAGNRRELNEPRQMAGLFGIEMIQGVVIKDIAANTAIEQGRVKVGDGSYTAFAFDEGLPEFLDPGPDRRDNAQPGDDDSSFCHGALKQHPGRIPRCA